MKYVDLKEKAEEEAEIQAMRNETFANLWADEVI